MLMPLASMLPFQNGGYLVQGHLPELPAKVGTVYCDVETTSQDKDLAAINPWHHTWIAGIAVTWDDHPHAYYISLRHLHQCGSTISVEQARKWLQALFSRADCWCNHNVKFDAHVVFNDLGVTPPPQLKDTLNLSKIIDSDRVGAKGGYGIEKLSKAWLGIDIEHFKEKLKPYLVKNKDYGRIPADICGEYACEDVFTVRRLERFIEARCADQCRKVWQLEQDLTPVLFGIEQSGLRVDPMQLKVTNLKVVSQMLALDEKICERAGVAFKPDYGPDCAAVLCGKLGYPVIQQTETGAASMAKDVLGLYLAQPSVDVELVQWIMDYRKLSTFKGLFLDAFDRLRDGRNFLHTLYNQTVRTGRMSAKEPNAQQFNKLAKQLVLPDDEGYSFLSADYSQVEFRLMVHYIEDGRLIKAYQRNPWLDIHQQIADDALITRKPAKTINFSIGFGQGQANTIKALCRVPEFVAEVKRIAREQTETDEAYERLFHHLAKKKGNKVYGDYHRMLPSLKPTSRMAERAARGRGYIFNAYGRRRHLSRERAHIAFNTLNQGTSADITKEATVRLARFLPSVGMSIKALVHDEILMHGPTKVVRDPEVQREIRTIMETPSVPLRVPIRTDAGWSPVNWAQAAGDHHKVPGWSFLRGEVEVNEEIEDIFVTVA